MLLTSLSSYLSRPARPKKVEDALEVAEVPKRTFYDWLTKRYEPKHLPDALWPLVEEAAAAKGESGDELTFPSGRVYRHPQAGLRAAFAEMRAEVAALKAAVEALRNAPGNPPRTPRRNEKHRTKGRARRANGHPAKSRVQPARKTKVGKAHPAARATKPTKPTPTKAAKPKPKAAAAKRPNGSAHRKSKPALLRKPAAPPARRRKERN